MNIVLATDDNYIQHCCVTIVSVLSSNKNVTFFILTEGLKDSNFNVLEDLVKPHNSNIHQCVVDSNIISHFPMPKSGGEHISIATYYRLLAEYLLPPNVKKFIYMDCDIVVRHSLLELWNTNIEDYALGAVFQNIGSLTEQDYTRFGYPSIYGYFNAGVLLVNLEYWRRNSVTKRLLNFINNNFNKIKQHDQDTLNAVLYKEVLPLDGRWNFLPLFYLIKKPLFPRSINYPIPKDPVIVHYVSVPKPWEFGCDNPYTSEYYKYIQYTSFSGYKTKFEFIKVWRNCIKPKLIKVLILMDIYNLRKILRR